MAMTPHYFTLEEANTIITQIRPLMAELLKRRARVVSHRPYLHNIVEDFHSNTGSALATSVALDFFTIERLLDQIRAHGCVIKDINVGLIDFLTERDGREVFLCWRYGEDAVAFYHDLHTGFNSRRPV